jgi:imidazolonepropionase-like amidohydrolase
MNLLLQEKFLQDRNSKHKLIRANKIIDGSGKSPINHGMLLIEGTDIIAVGREHDLSIPEDSHFQEFNYDEATILPGLVDCHVHLNGVGDGRVGDDLALLPDEIITLQSARNARQHLYSGVTTARDCGAKNNTTFMLRMAVDMGITIAPRMVLSGRPIAIIGGHLSYFGEEVTGPVECKAAVRQLIKEGADFIKVTATGGSTRTSLPLSASFTLEELTTICDEAHNLGKHVAAHCTSTPGILNALDSGVDTIIHGYSRDSDGILNFHPSIADRLAKNEVFVNPTLYQHIARYRILKSKLQSSGLTDKETQEFNEIETSHQVKNEYFSKMREAGVTLVCGSDSAWAYYEMGDFNSEIEAHCEIGMSPTEAIVASTYNSSKSCWINGEVGTIEPGKKADLLIVNGNPDSDISDLRNIVDVFQEGKIVDRFDKI